MATEVVGHITEYQLNVNVNVNVNVHILHVQYHILYSIKYEAILCDI